MTTQIVSVDATTSKLQVGAVDAFQFQANGVMSGFTSINAGFLYGNRVINGAMEIDQVLVGAAQTPPGSAILADMFGFGTNQASKLTFQQVADAPAGLKNSTKVTVASQYAPAATDFFTLQTSIEGINVIDFKFGTAGAATITLSNWIKGSVAGTYTVSLRNAASNRSYVGTVTVTTSWAQVKVTLAGDTAGTWLTDTGIGLSLIWDLGSGTNFNTTAGTWQAGNFTRTSGSVTFVNQVAGSTLNITGVDCRLGSGAPAVFERRPFAVELALCQRYWEKSYDLPTAIAASTTIGATYHMGATDTSGNMGATVIFKVSKRSIPTMSFYTSVGTAGSWAISNAGGATNSAPVASFIGLNQGLIYCSGFGTAWAAGVVIGHWTANSRLF